MIPTTTLGILVTLYAREPNADFERGGFPRAPSSTRRIPSNDVLNESSFMIDVGAKQLSPRFASKKALFKAGTTRRRKLL